MAETQETQSDESMEEIQSDESVEEASDALEEIGDDLAFLRGENDNLDYYLASKAYHDDRNYEEAIEKFQSAIKYEEHAEPIQETEGLEKDPGYQASEEPGNEVITKSMYWMAESHVKIQQLDQAIDMFEKLASDFDKNHLALAAQRRIATLKESRQLLAESETV